MNVKLLMCHFNGYGNGMNINMLVTDYAYNAILIIYDNKTNFVNRGLIYFTYK